MAKRRAVTNGRDDSGANIAGRKRKSQQNQQQLFMNEKDYRLRLQEVMYDAEYILAKVFRKDGPPLGDQFDTLPSNAVFSDCGTSHHKENPVGCKRSKVSMHSISGCEACIANSSTMRCGPRKGPVPAKRSPLENHGMGKGLMKKTDSPWRKHGVGKGLMTLKDASGIRHGIGKGLMTIIAMREEHGIGKGSLSAMDISYGDDCIGSTIRKKKRVNRESVATKLAKIKVAKRKTALRNKKNIEKKKLLPKDNCKLGIDDVKRIENAEQFAKLLDDEELELKESQSGTRVLSCCARFPVTASHGCPLCKDLLTKFPPSSVIMKTPLPMKPWASSPLLVTKFFKAFHFLCTYAVTIRIQSFTLDDFSQAFYDKNSLLLGQVHLSLLRLLLLEVEKELGRRIFSSAIKNCKFLNLLHSLDGHDFVLESWKKSLNHLTWCEILRQVFVKAGFGSKMDVTHKPNCNQEVNIMDKYALSTGTLKGELFLALLNQGKSGMEVSDLAKSPSIQQLNLTDALHELEDLISSALSSDITLFEKISLSAYRLRARMVEKETEDYLSGSEDFGSGDDISEVTGGNDANESEHDSGGSSPYNEIDESHNGEVWLLGLMEGEYSDLRIEDKLDALVTLIDLLSASSCIRMEDQLVSNDACPSSVPHGSGAKVKRLTAKKFRVFGLPGGKTFSPSDINMPGQPVDSWVSMSKIAEEKKRAMMKMIAIEMDVEEFTHPMQSIFLGSDRRYNRYWLFLGPCNGFDPGHQRIYFQSSEDGNWEIIDTEEALCSLVSALDSRGAREAHLLASLGNIKETLISAMSNMPNCFENQQLMHPDESELNISREDSASLVSDVDNRSSMSEMQNGNSFSSAREVCEIGKNEKQLVKTPHNSRAFDASVWKSFYHELTAVKKGKKACLDLLRRCDHCHDLYWRDEKHCRICHTTFELDFDLDERYAPHSAVCHVNFDTKKNQRQKILSCQLQALKAAVYAIELAMPEDALIGSWRKSSHKLWVSRLRRVWNLKEFLQVVADFVTSLNEQCLNENKYSDLNEIISSFSTVPRTYSAVALWLVKLDLSLAYHEEHRSSAKI